MTAGRVVLVGASAGGVGALERLVSMLEPDLPACVVVVLHVPIDGPSYLPQILARSTRLPVRHAVDGDVLAPGTVLIAPPGSHTLIVDGTVRLDRGPSEHAHRPAIDPLFRSGAATHGAAVVGVLLTGLLRDGVAGLAEIKRLGGTVVVQDPDDAPFPSMPRAAIEQVDVDHVVALAAMAPLLGGLVRGLPPGASGEAELLADSAVSGYTCPDCQGALWELEHGTVAQFRCRIGHRWTLDTLEAGEDAAVERALWTAMRILAERADLQRRLIARADGRGLALGAGALRRRLDELEGQMAALRAALGHDGERVPEVGAPDTGGGRRWTP